MHEWTARSVFWWTVTWLLRLGLLFLAFALWGSFQQSRWLLATETTGILAVVFGLQRVARRQALGWIIDDNGERQKVTSWSRGHAIFTPTTRSQRIVEEAQLRDERRRQLVWWGIPGWGLSGLAVYLVVSNARMSDGIFFLVIMSALFGGVPLLGWLGAFGKEVLYLSRWQDMPGAKVLDERPYRPGLQEVEQQKAHGAGRVANEAEALAILNQGT